MPQEISFAQVLQQLMDERYRRNRAALADAVHISPSALSQYVRGRATPSLDVLVHLAEVLDVSLEYLVFGRERVAPPAELGYLPYLEAHMRNIEAQGASLHDLVARIGAKVGESVLVTAKELLPETTNLGGVLSPTDITSIERCNAHTTIVTTDLSLEVLALKHDGRADPTGPSVFAQVVAENIKEGGHYEYVVPRGAEWNQEARLLRQEVTRLTELSALQVDRHLQVLQVPSACVPGYIVHHFSIERLQRQAVDVAERVARFTYLDPENEEMGFVAHSEMMNQHFDLITKENVPRILHELQTLRRDPSNRPHQAGS